jgi:hypothetical protein|tara:strand:- start:766 stop:1023 length:258 start_codon:yes stop_codon:yes gene_type:complete
MILEIILVLMVLLFIASCYVIWNLTTKQEMLEDWIEDFIQSVEKVDFDLKQADYRGSFESDDEVGAIFKQIKEIIKQLDKFKGEE